MRRLFPLLLILLLAHPAASGQQPIAARDGLAAPDSATVAWSARTAFRQRLEASPLWTPAVTRYAIEHPHPAPDRTADFYLLLGLVLILGAIRIAHPRYFGALWRAFYHPTHTPGSVKDRIETAAVPNALMNGLFAATAGAYLYAVVRVYRPAATPGALPASLLLLLLVAGVAAVYAVKWVVIRFSGWAFGVSTITEHYLFNVALVNKIMAVALLPFIVLLAFADPAWVSPLVAVSLLVVAALFAVRYVRSWGVFGSFFQYSRFHFLAYFCASEILPLAVLAKLAARALFG